MMGQQGLSTFPSCMVWYLTHLPKSSCNSSYAFPGVYGFGRGRIE